MSLDSVALIVEFEDFFGIKIPDAECARIVTVNDAVVCIERHVKNMIKTVSIFESVKADFIYATEKADATLDLKNSSRVFQVVPLSETQFWIQVSQYFTYDLPFSIYDSKWNRFFGRFTRQVNENVTLDELIDVICAINYEKLVTGPEYSSYEILTAVRGITSSKLGVSPYNVTQSTRFIDDLGID